MRDLEVAIRSHTKINQTAKDLFPRKPDRRKPYGHRLLVFDTETTTDCWQNFRYGVCLLIDGGKFYQAEKILFHAENLSPQELETIRTWANADKTVTGIVVMPLREFVAKVLIPEVFIIGSVCTGFNLLFDLSRLAINVKTRIKGKHKDRFELILHENKTYPSIGIEPVNNKMVFYSTIFHPLVLENKERKHYRQGRFLDLRTLAFALTNETHSLASACKLYKMVHQKTVSDETGFDRITPQNLGYCLNDTLCTGELALKLLDELKTHPITLEAGKAYSPASIGKAYYRTMGIKPFSETQSTFPDEFLGYAMAAYYGGRSECRYRRKPVKVFHTDILSMYPTVFTLQGLWPWVIAKGFGVVEETEEITCWLENIGEDDLFKPDTWANLPGLAKVLPDNDLLPVRAKYKNSYQIGLNHLASEEPMYYTLADLAACKLLTGKLPKILQAWRIVPQDCQDGLVPVKIKGQVDINPVTDDFFKRIIELRHEYKKAVQESGDLNDSLQIFLKILANATGYGIYMELNREESRDAVSVQVHSHKQFACEMNDCERPGRYYNPLIGTMITSAARLMLALVQKSVENFGGGYAFCDTDSVAVIDLVDDKPEIIGQKVIKKFESLLPYGFPGSLLQAEDCNWQRLDWEQNKDKGNVKKDGYHPLYCFCVSAKRYVLYNLIPNPDGGQTIVIRKQTYHGMGHLASPTGLTQDEMMVEVWKMNIAREHGLDYAKPDWFQDVALARTTVRKPSVHRMLNRQRGLDYSETVKLGNFFNVGYTASSPYLPFGGSETVGKFYCHIHKTWGYGHCADKRICGRRENCLANTHLMAIAPYDRHKAWQDRDWIEKTTKENLIVKLNFDVENYEDLPRRTANDVDCVYLKRYWDFIEQYHRHPEVKFDDADGKPADKWTKGLLQSCQVKAGKITLIGKEADTIMDEEEWLELPDEKMVDKKVLQYEAAAGPVGRQAKINAGEWKAMQKWLVDNAKPRRDWAEKMGVSERYFKRLLSGERKPSPETLARISGVCGFQVNGHQKAVPTGGQAEPRPARLDEERKGKILSVLETAKTVGLSLEEIKQRFKGWVVSLNNEPYLDASVPECRTLLTNLQQMRRNERELQKEQNLSHLKLFGTNREGKQIVFEPGDILRYTVEHTKGFKWKALRVCLKDRQVLRIRQGDNRLAFSVGLLPNPNRLPWNEAETTKWKQDGRSYQHSPWTKYRDLPWTPWSKAKRHYRVTDAEFKQDIANHKFPESAYRIEADGKTAVNPVIMWQVYGRKEENSK